MLKGFIFSVPAACILYIGTRLDGDAGFSVLFFVFLAGCPISIISIPIGMVAWAMSMNKVVGMEFVLILSFISLLIGVHINSIILINFITKKTGKTHAVKTEKKSIEDQ